MLSPLHDNWDYLQLANLLSEMYDEPLEKIRDRHRQLVKLRQKLMAFICQCERKRQDESVAYVRGLATIEKQKNFFRLSLRKRAKTVVDWMKKSADPNEVIQVPWLREYIWSVRDGLGIRAYKNDNSDYDAKDFLSEVSLGFGTISDAHEGSPKPGRIPKNISRLIWPPQLATLGIIYDLKLRSESHKAAKSSVDDYLRELKPRIPEEMQIFATFSEPLLPEDKYTLIDTIRKKGHCLKELKISRTWGEEYQITTTDVSNAISWWVSLRKKFAKSDAYLAETAFFSRHLVIPRTEHGPCEHGNRSKIAMVSTAHIK